MHKSVVKLRFQNGLDFELFKKDVFDIYQLTEFYDFQESNEPDFVVFGPYGIDMPKPGRYTRIGYFCENMMPDLNSCEWAFGVMPEEKINSTCYKRIQWHGLDPLTLVKPSDYDVEGILRSKKHFCNFLYSNLVPYREEFFRQLSKYKRVDAPGKSMNNMPGIDQARKHTSLFWDRKRAFLSAYKFTIAFENYVSPGYQTEKLYDAMQADSLPIYCGDPFIGEIFNTQSFINVLDFAGSKKQHIVNWLEDIGRQNIEDILPRYYKSPALRVRRKLKSASRALKMKYQFRKFDFTPVIERIIELDKSDDQYVTVLQQPWFNHNAPPVNSSLKQRWIEIFSKVGSHG